MNKQVIFNFIKNLSEIGTNLSYLKKFFAALRFLFRLCNRFRRFEFSSRQELQPCTGVWGEVEVRESLPDAKVYENVMLLPFSGTPIYDQDPDWGVYCSDGRLIEDAALRRGGSLVGQSLLSGADISKLSLLDDNVVYGGVIIAHFGHFICTSLSRLWWLAEEPLGDRKVVFHGAREIQGELAFHYISTCFDRLGLNRETAAVIRQPVAARSLAIPQPSFEEQGFVTPEFRNLCHHIGKPWWRTRITSPLPPVYLSKGRLTGGVNRLRDELLVEDTLRAGGVEIIYPEELSLPDQVGLFSEERTILGSIGSAFHASIFTPPISRMICLSPSSVINSNMRLLDKINKNQVSYLYPDSGCEDTGVMAGFDHTWILKNPTRVAEELLDLAFSKHF